MRHSTLFPILAMLFAGRTQAQYPLENAYPDAAIGSGMYNVFFLHAFEDLGHRYIHVIRDSTTKVVNLYDLSHNLVQTIDLSNAVDVNPTNPTTKTAFLFSQYLFDLDPGIELMFVSGGTVTCATSIVDESGEVLQQWLEQAPWVYHTVPNQMSPVVNTPNGTKLLLSDITTGETKVYALPGTLPGCCNDLSTSVQGAAGGHMAEAFPVPAHSSVTISFGATAWVRGIIEVLAADGKRVATFPVNGNQVVVPLAGLATGAYAFRVTHGDQPYASGTFLKE
jgi:hypothetical protein